MIDMYEIVISGFIMFFIGMYLGYQFCKGRMEKELHIVTGKSAEEFRKKTGLN